MKKARAFRKMQLKPTFGGCWPAPGKCRMPRAQGPNREVADASAAHGGANRGQAMEAGVSSGKPKQPGDKTGRCGISRSKERAGCDRNRISDFSDSLRHQLPCGSRVSATSS